MNKTYEPKDFEERIYKKWLDKNWKDLGDVIFDE